MPEDNDWAAMRILEARVANPKVTEAVFDRMNALFREQVLCQQPLTKNQLKSVALGLIADMAPLPLEQEVMQ